jgi:hypothetical protein
MILLLLSALGLACGFMLFLGAAALGYGGETAALLAGVVGTVVGFQIVGRLMRDHQ